MNLQNIKGNGIIMAVGPSGPLHSWWMYSKHCNIYWVWAYTIYQEISAL